MFTHSYAKRSLSLTTRRLWPCPSGVLLLNAVLTVRAHQANSHKDKGWETFTDAVVQWLSNNLEGLVFMLWGAYAQKKGAAINRVSPHCCFTAEAIEFILLYYYLYFYVFTETPPCPAGGASFSSVCSSRVFWVQTFLKGQRAAEEIWKDSHWLDGTLNTSL